MLFRTAAILAIAPFAVASPAKVCKQFPYSWFEWISVFPQAISACSANYPVATVTSYTTLPAVTSTTTVGTITTTVATTTSTQHDGTVTATAATDTITAYTTVTSTSTLSTTDHTGQTTATANTVTVTALTPTVTVTQTTTTTQTSTTYSATTTQTVAYTPPASKRDFVEKRKAACKQNDFWCQEWQAINGWGASFASTLCACIEATPTRSVTVSPTSTQSVIQTISTTQTVLTNIPSTTTLYPSTTTTITSTSSTTLTLSTNIPPVTVYTPTTTSTPPASTSTVFSTVTTSTTVQGGTSTASSMCPSATPNVCHGKCVNKATDVNNCGGCGSVCVSNAICQQGGCNIITATVCNNPTPANQPYSDGVNNCVNSGCYCIPSVDQSSLGVCIPYSAGFSASCNHNADCPNGSVCLNGINGGIIPGSVNVCSIPGSCTPPSARRREVGGLIGPRGVHMLRNPAGWVSIKERSQQTVQPMSPQRPA